MEVILIDDVYRLGRRGEVVTVQEGYGRNYLIPKKLAIAATAGNLKNIEQQRSAMAKKETRHRDEAELLANDLSQKHILISRKSGDTGVLFGSVSSKDITKALESGGIHLDRRKILLSQPVKAIGTITVAARPHADVEAELLVSVLPEADEAICKVIPRGIESDEIIEALEAKIGEARQAEPEAMLEENPGVTPAPPPPPLEGEAAADEDSAEAESQRRESNDGVEREEE